jgi:AcrR family transcriptional regulator
MIQDSGDVAGEGQGIRQRGPGFVEAVLAATIEELAERGYEGLTIPAVAARAGANKTSVYRRWPSKSDLVRAALETAMEARADVESAASNPGGQDSGTLRSRILKTLKDAAMGAGTPAWRGAIRSLLGTVGSEEVSGIAKALLTGPSAEGHKTLILEAKARGEVHEGLDPSLVLTVLSGSLLQRTVVEGREADDAFLESLVDLILEGIRAG